MTLTKVYLVMWTLGAAAISSRANDEGYDEDYDYDPDIEEVLHDSGEMNLTVYMPTNESFLRPYPWPVEDDPASNNPSGTAVFVSRGNDEDYSGDDTEESGSGEINDATQGPSSISSSAAGQISLWETVAEKVNLYLICLLLMLA